MTTDRTLRLVDAALAAHLAGQLDREQLEERLFAVAELALDLVDESAALATSRSSRRRACVLTLDR